MKYLPGPMEIIKDNLFTIPPVFELIQKNAGSDFKEMYQVFNMGHRLELFTHESMANKIMAVAESLGIEAKVIGRVNAAKSPSLVLQGQFGALRFQY